MTTISLRARAKVRIRHERTYDYDEKRGLYLRRLEGEEEVYNLLLDGGRVALHTYVYGTTAQRTSAGLGTGFNYIALSDDATAPAAGDTTLTAELTTDGLQRVQGTVTLPTGSGTITTIENVFTFSGVSQGVQKAALFDDPTAGLMAHEVQFTERVMATTDTLTVTYSITLT